MAKTLEISRVFVLCAFSGDNSGGATRNRTGDEGFADLCLTAWLWRRIHFKKGTLKAYLSVPLERITRLELATSTLARWRSTR